MLGPLDLSRVSPLKPKRTRNPRAPWLDQHRQCKMFLIISAAEAIARVMASSQRYVQGRASSILAVVGVCCSAFTLLYCVRQRRDRRKCLREPHTDKPQTRFQKVLADNSRAPFVHLLSLDGAHPCSEKIRALLDNPPRTLMHHDFQKRPPDLDRSCEWIDSRVQLEKLAFILSQETEFAVDTEQHSVHSFLGFTALIQISTFTNDYLVDTIALHDDMDILQPAFANPNVCKVFHGADSDSLWLQRDFHIYIVNLFDTARACDVLGKQQRSLAFLLQEHCGVTTNKVFQRADWRQRPLPQEMLHYARVDTHYLLYIAHCLEDELHTEGKLQHVKDTVEESPFVQVVLRSNSLCKQLYDKDGASASPQSAALSLISRYCNTRVPGRPRSLEDDDVVRKIIKLICEWRDNIARSEDESVQAVLSNSAVLALATCQPMSTEAILHVLSADSASEKSTRAVVMSRVESLRDLINQAAGKAGLNCETNVWEKWQKMIPCGSSRSFVTSMFSALFADQRQNVSEDQDAEGFGSVNLDGNSLTVKDCSIPKGRNQENLHKSRAQFMKRFSCKTPVYHNCRIYAGDGRLLCYCDRKKLEWYVNRGLAEFVDEDPPAVKLLFEPKGRPEDENNEFYILSKTNRCVGCGEKNHYLRYRVIPSCYRQNFPEYLKTHRSHDIVLLCVDCHEVAHRAAERHKHEIAQEFGVPLFLGRVGGKTGKFGIKNEGNGVTQDISPMRLRNAAMALLRHGETLPSGRRKELEAVVKTYYGGRSFSPEGFQVALISCIGLREHRRILRSKGSQMMVFPRNLREFSASISDRDSLDQLEFKNADRLVPSEPQVDKLLSPVSIQAPDGKEGSVANEGDSNQSSSKSLTKAQGDSLLGHGPHGKKVVEILYRQGGDDAIRSFNQRWRRVFVHALQPAFLPPGWDIHHSGHREFGDHSVYKAKVTCES